ncbi:VanZ family protein [Desulfofundulus thermosubterraneus]|uniref:VanZ family protein n=1 Tax=Desulfofundulus thermosubterraneus TaxID=348840 RepID=UPI0013F4D426|nr:VanZ family protein [Desulfofundulus thermosubterraneus]
MAYRKRWWRWLLVGACLLVIAYFSSQPFAEQDLRPEIRPYAGLVERVRELPPVSFSYSGQPVDSRRAPADFIQFWLRKGAHVVIYGALGLSLAAALGGTGSGGRRHWMLAGVIVVLVAALDEWHQTFVPGRTGRALDVLVDLAGFVVLAFLPETHLIPLVLQAALGLRPKVIIFGERGYSVNQAAACFLKPFWT